MEAVEKVTYKMDAEKEFRDPKSILQSCNLRGFFHEDLTFGQVGL